MTRPFSSGASWARVAQACSLLLPVALVPVAVVLMGAALMGSDDLPAEARTLVGQPSPADRVAPAPEELSSAAVLRDWEEVSTSPSTQARAPARTAKGTGLTTRAPLGALLKSRKLPK
ncbi:hypothetical protein GobsT_15180 [Gemmata obscuriglobus]|uniref:hypothetical protein n=1 Tax=Gemmata obscuriglobus TaxID=114 RepID=UPI0011CCF31B|nr:hypothetical protein [Gemmata obscuriglobus]QEG26771.1 hypothetical protein GobsT_15180 [Gemmata obscuriglobus]VTS02603.1 unnamed protein product [Gemmata obscuriglobus UQM 2246]